MEAFEYFAPRSVAEVYTHLGNGKTTLMLAGGTDVIVQLREGRRRCDQLIDLKHIPELVAHGFSGDGTLIIGAAAPLAELYENPEVRRRLPGLVDAASLI
ncbi:MAG: FAD binding domain-containing protein, partial [Tepidiformaceae bacterium]